MYYGFAILITTMIEVAGLLGKGLVTGICYGFDIDNEGFYNTGFFETDHNIRCLYCSCIGMGLVTYYIGLVMILEGIGNGNII